MIAFLIILGVLEIVGGVAVFATAKSAIHEILGTLAIGFAMLQFGQAAQLIEAQRTRGVLEKLFAPPQSNPSPQPQLSARAPIKASHFDD